MELYNRLCTITKQENVMKDEPMKKHTTFRIGGPADYFVTPESKEEIQAIVELCKKEEIPYSVIGNGSNLQQEDYFRFQSLNMGLETEVIFLLEIRDIVA